MLLVSSYKFFFIEAYFSNRKLRLRMNVSQWSLCLNFDTLIF